MVSFESCGSLDERMTGSRQAWIPQRRKGLLPVAVVSILT